jgi:peptide/nickel transport system permease protein
MSRIAYILRRMLQMIPTALGVTILVFFLIHLIPGDPARAFLGPHATLSLVKAFEKRWGLNQSLPVQYWLFISRLVRGDLGTSFFYQLPVTTLIMQRIGCTLLLLLYGTVFTIAITVPLALIAATKRDSLRDHIIRGIPLVGLGMPTFWVGIMLILTLGLKLQLFPVGGYGNGLLEHLWSMVLPGLTVAFAISPMTIRSLRASMLGILESDFVTTARSKGIPERRVIGIHAMRNAVIPAITVLSLNIGWLVGGSVVIEQVFALPGLGDLMFEGIFNRDFAVVQGVTLVFAVLIILVYLATDIVYSFVDPRVRLT